MFPIGDFKRLRQDIMAQYDGGNIPITFGVLIADYRQSAAREYILNYIDIFDRQADKYIDFSFLVMLHFLVGNKQNL